MDGRELQLLGRDTQRGQETDKAVPEGLARLLDGLDYRLPLGYCMVSGGTESRSILGRARERIWKRRASASHRQNKLELLHATLQEEASAD